jgi:hypothetical protein
MTRPVSSILLLSLTAACGVRVAVDDGPTHVDDLSSVEACLPLATNDAAVGSLVITSSAIPECRVVVSGSTTVIKGSTMPGSAEPHYYLARDGRGRLFSFAEAGVVGVWDSTGVFIQTLGRPGDGPGELVGYVSAIPGPDGRIHLRDNRPSWSVFGTDLRFVRRVSAPFTTADAMAFLDNGDLAVSPPPDRLMDYRFAIVDSLGAIRKKFGQLRPLNPAGARPEEYESLIASAGGERFWAASPYRYEFEEWSTDGTLIRTIRREADWFPDRVSVDEIDDEAPKPFLVRIRMSKSGLLWAVTKVADRNWSRPPVRGEDTSPWDRVDFMVEVIDTRSGVLVASFRADQPIEALAGFLDDEHAYRITESEYGVQTFHLFRYGLSRAPSPALRRSQ